MKLSLLLTALLSIASISFAPSKGVQAMSFNEQEVNQNHFAVIAAPYHHGYNLVLVEQILGQQRCWAEKGNSPVQVEPLFLNFDFTNACKKSSDSNSYSIRFNGKDYGLDYLLDIVKKDGELHLVGIPRDKTKPQFFIGRPHGLNNGSLKIVLEPQWRLTKRAYGQKVTEHIYLSYDSPKSGELVSHTLPTSNPVTQPANNSATNAHQESHPKSITNVNNPQPINNYPQNVYQYQQPAYPVQVAPQQPSGNVYQYQQPAYPVQPLDNSYRRY